MPNVYAMPRKQFYSLVFGEERFPYSALLFPHLSYLPTYERALEKFHKYVSSSDSQRDKLA